MEISRPHLVRIVALDEGIAPRIREALYKAIYNPGDSPLPQGILEDERLSKYHESWGKEGDFGYAAVLEGAGEVVGMCWCRLFRGTNRGFGYVDDDTPELSIAVWEAFRGKGIGGRLLDATISEARSRGYGGLSLSVQRENRSVSLYRRSGFKILRCADDAYTMYLGFG